MTRRTFAVSLIASTLVAGETAKDRGKRLIGKVIEGLGGDAFRNMRSRTEIGRASSFYRDQLTGYSQARILTRYLEPDPAAPGASARILQLERQVFGRKMEDGATLFTANEGYDVTYRGAKPLADDKVRQYREATLHNVFYILRERLFLEPGIEIEAVGADIVENQPVEAIDIYDSEDRNIRVWVNADTFLPVKQRYERWDPSIGERREEVTRYTTYRPAGEGIMWPHTTTRERDTEMVSEFRSERVTVNDALPDSLFELPNGIKILK